MYTESTVIIDYTIYIYRVAQNFGGSLFFAEWRYFGVLRLGQTGFTCWELIFAIFSKSRSNGLITFNFFIP